MNIINILKDNKVRISLCNEYISIYDLFDFINKNRGNSRNIFSRLNKQYLNIKYIKFSGSGQRETPCIYITDINKLILLFLPGSRKSKTQKDYIMKMFSIKDYDKYMFREYIEEEIHDKIKKVFKNFNLQQQFPILSYRIDLYFIDLKIAIECDENFHSNYNEENEIKRHNLITENINCTWIRYDPYNKNFCIFDLINKINIEILKKYKNYSV